jgi:TPR repeat protein
MANNGGRICPKCGMNLGQKNLCPICDRTEENSGNTPPGPEMSDSIPLSQTADYISRAIGFIGEHPDDWDNEFNAFFDGLAGDSDFDEVYDFCSTLHDSIRIDAPTSGSIPGSLTRQVMTILRDLIPELTGNEARALALDYLRKRMRTAVPGAEDCLRLGNSYYYGDAEAAKWYRLAADQGSAEAQVMLGRCYYSGQGVNRNCAEAVKWFRLAADQDNVEALYRLGICCYWGQGVPQNFDEADRLFRRAAEQGNAEAQNMVGEYYYFGGSGLLEPNFKDAVKWFRLAADQGNADAQYHLGYCCKYGWGVDQDDAQAAEWYRKAAEQGHGLAQNDLGVLYAQGRGVEKDRTEALKWFRLAAERKDPDGLKDLANCYAVADRGVEPDKGTFLKWNRMAAELGQHRAIKLLSEIHQQWPRS